MISHQGRFTVTASGNSFMTEYGPKSGNRNIVTASRHKVLADGSMSQGGQSVGFVGKNDKKILDDFILSNKHGYYEDIYYHDAVGGGAVDMFSMMPFSDFTLIGIKDKKILDVFARSVENLRPENLLPSVSRDYLVHGHFIGSTIFDSDAGYYTNVIPHSSEHCQLKPVGIYGVDPLIDLTMPKEISKVLMSGDKRLSKLVAHIPQAFKQGGKIELDPDGTLFIPRLGLSSDTVGTSYYERILPYYIMERALFRGSIELSQRRLKSTLHISMGDGEWVPTNEEMEDMKNLYLAAEVDPSGAIIVTRNGITPNEVRNGTDFWRYSEDESFLSSGKYKALNITEAFISGEASYNALDQSMTVIVENMRHHRDIVTRKLFYEKIFPRVAVSNDFKNNSAYKVTSTAREIYEADGYRIITAGANKHILIGSESYNSRDFIMPKIRYHKSLRPEGDSAYIELLNTVSEKGVPIPIAMYAAAAGLDIHDLIDAMDGDLQNAKKIGEYKKKLAATMPKENDDENGSRSESAVAQALAMAQPGTGSSRIGLFNRDYGDDVLPFAVNEKGFRKNTSLKDRNRRKERLIKIGAQVLAEQARKHNARERG